MGRGTEIVLHLKEDALPDYVDQDVLKKLVTKYSEFINFPIYLWASHEEEKEVPLTPEEIAATKKDKEEEDSGMFCLFFILLTRVRGNQH